MSRIIKRRFKQHRMEFKRDLRKAMDQNAALAMLAVETYRASQHRRHIGLIWQMFRNPNYAEFQREYDDQLFGKHLTGDENIWRSLHFADRDLYDRYSRKIPETMAMGDAVGVAYQILNKQKR